MAELFGNHEQILKVITDYYKNSPRPTYIKDMDNRYITVSKSFMEYFGTTDESVFIGKTAAEANKNRIISTFYDQYDKDFHASNEECFSSILPSFLDPSGGQHYVRVEQFFIRDEAGEPIAISGIAFDCTRTYEAKSRFDRQSDKFLRLNENDLCCAFIDVTEWRMLDLTVLEDNHVVHKTMDVDTFIITSDRNVSAFSDSHDFFKNLNRNSIIKKFNAGDLGDHEDFHVEKKDSGEPIWVRYEYVFLVNPENNHICILLSVSDVSAQKNEFDNLVRAAEQDSMTGLYNHESAMEKINTYIKQNGKTSLSALFIIDIDNFKSVNDRFGHRTGDTVIIDTAERISSCFTEYDIIGRIGGDEFLVLMKNIDSAWTATNKGAELINALQYECRRDGESIFLTASIGIAIINDNVNVEDVYSEADEALYKAKYSGKNKYMLSDRVDFSSFDSVSKVADISVDLQTVLNGIDGVFFIAEIENDELRILYTSNQKYNQDSVDQLMAEDYDALMKSIKTSYANGTSLDYTFARPYKFYDKMKWCHAKGNFLDPDRPDTIKFTMIVTDVFTIKNTQQLLEIENTKNNLALSISNILIWEYDTTTKLITLHNSDEASIPYWNEGMCYAKSANDYLGMYSQLESGVPEGTFFIHFKSFFGKQMWMQVSFKTTFDESGHVIGALFAAIDVTNFMNVVDKYEAALRRFSVVNEEQGTAFHLDLSENKILNTVNNYFSEMPADISTADEFFAYIRSFMICSDERAADLKDSLSVKNAINALAVGNDMLEEEVFCQLNTEDSEWFLLRLYPVTNPDTKNKELIGYFRNVNSEHISQTIIESIVSSEFETICVIDINRHTFKTIQDKTGRYSNINESIDYEDYLYNTLGDYVLENEVQDCAFNMDLHNLIKELKKNAVRTLSVSVYENINGQIEIRRKRYQYTFIDESQKFIAMTKSDITDQYNSEFDPLTGLYNRNSFYQHCAELFEANPRTSFMILRWDIDRFKVFNDTFGTDAGDELLAMIGNAYRDRIVDNVIVANLGADNFALCMPMSYFSIDEQTAFLDNLFSSITTTYSLTYHMAGYRITDTSLDLNIMCDRAAFAIKTIKESNSVRFVWYDEQMRENVIKEQELIAQIRTAFDTNQFQAFVQPQFNQMTHKLVSGEVLARWVKEDGSTVMPSIFVPLMEKSGLISRLDELIWEKAAEYIHERKVANKPIVPLAVNISVKDFYRPNFCQFFYDLIEKYEIEASDLDLEITESAYIENTDLLVSRIQDLRNRGFKIKMDDFGAGYSSLNTLKDVPVDMIKLDMAFINFADNDEEVAFRGGVILDSILRMSHWLGIPVIAEGVETAKQAEFLKSIDCAIIQGYFFSKPLPLDEFSIMLDTEADTNQITSLTVSSNFDSYDFWDPSSYSSILFNSFLGPAGIFEYYNGKVTPLRLNDMFYHELKVTPEDFDFFHTDILDLVHSDDYEDFSNFLNEITKNTDKYYFEGKWIDPGTLKNPSGNVDTLWVLLKARRIAYTEKRFIFFVSIENTTERKELEFSNMGLANRLISFVDTLPGGAFIFEVTNTINVSYMSDKLFSLFGYSKHSEDDVDRFNPLLSIDEDDRDKVFDALWSKFENSEPKSLNVRAICKDGSRKWITLLINIPSFDEGKTIGFCQITSVGQMPKLNADMSEIEAIASHSNLLISRYNIRTNKIVHYYQFSDYFDIPADVPVDNFENIAKYEIFKAEVPTDEFTSAISAGNVDSSVVFQAREKNGQYAPYSCKTTIVRDHDGNPLFATMSLKKIKQYK